MRNWHLTLIWPGILSVIITSLLAESNFVSCLHFRNYVLSMSRGMEDMGGVKWQLALCLLAAWVIAFLCLSKGVQSSGKVSSLPEPQSEHHPARSLPMGESISNGFQDPFLSFIWEWWENFHGNWCSDAHHSTFHESSLNHNVPSISAHLNLLCYVNRWCISLPSSLTWCWLFCSSEASLYLAPKRESSSMWSLTSLVCQKLRCVGSTSSWPMDELWPTCTGVVRCCRADLLLSESCFWWSDYAGQLQ